MGFVFRKFVIFIKTEWEDSISLWSSNLNSEFLIAYLIGNSGSLEHTVSQNEFVQLGTA